MHNTGHTAFGIEGRFSLVHFSGVNPVGARYRVGVGIPERRGALLQRLPSDDLSSGSELPDQRQTVADWQHAESHTLVIRKLEIERPQCDR